MDIKVDDDRRSLVWYVLGLLQGVINRPGIKKYLMQHGVCEHEIEELDEAAMKVANKRPRV